MTTENTNLPASFDQAELRIKQFEDTYATLEIKGLDDKEGYKTIDEARKLVKQTRLAIVRKKDDLNGPLIKEQKDNVAYCNKLVDMCASIEKMLEAKQGVIDQEKQRIQAEKDKQIEDRYLARVKQLSSFGMSFNGKEYVLAHLSWPVETILMMEDHDYTRCCQIAEKQFQAKQVADQQAADAMAAENKRIAEEKQAQLLKEKELEAKALELQRKEAILYLHPYVTYIPMDEWEQTINMVLECFKQSTGLSLEGCAKFHGERFMPKTVTEQPVIDTNVQEIVTEVPKIDTIVQETPKQQIADPGTIISSEKMREAATILQDHFPGMGFCLLVFEFNKTGLSNYISNAQREDMITAMKETVIRLSGNEDIKTPSAQ